MSTETNYWPAWVEINLKNLRHNIRLIKQKSAPAKVMAVVKADAYGHGVEQIVAVLQDEGITDFSVSNLAEAIALRKLALKDRILVLGAPLIDEVPIYLKYNLEITVSSENVLTALIGLKEPAKIHLKVDTGMHRLGVPPAEVKNIIKNIAENPFLTLAGVWTHFATADATDNRIFNHQRQLFLDSLPILSPETQVHFANSATIFGHNKSISPTSKLVRAGISLYGFNPVSGSAFDPELKPLMSLKARVVHVADLPAGGSVSYGHKWTTKKDTTIATLAIGYAEGYPRQVKNASVMIAGKLYPVVGTVCMNMIMIDLGGDDIIQSEIIVGTIATLFDTKNVTAETLAGWANTISYDICCGVSSRIPHIYHD